MKKPKTLTSRFVETVKVPGRFGDAANRCGLQLNVHQDGNGNISKSWIQHIVIANRRTHIGLGRFPIVGLADARAMALENMRAVKQGIDPRGGIPTFAEACEEVIALHAEAWKDGGKSEKQWRSTLTKYAYPKLGGMRVNKIKTADILAVLSPHWNQKHETMNRLKQRIGKVMVWCMGQNFIQHNPAEGLKAVLPKNNVPRKAHASIPFSAVSGALQTIRNSSAHWATIACIEFLAYTACRSGEARKAVWDEIDLENAVWNVPAENMKNKRPHKVPLSSTAIQILDRAMEQTGGKGLIFPSQRHKELSDGTMSKLIRELGLGFVPHGLRASFRIFCAEKTKFPAQVAEFALSHTDSDKVQAAYQRSDLFALRGELMQRWDDYLQGTTAKVVNLR